MCAQDSPAQAPRSLAVRRSPTPQRVATGAATLDAPARRPGRPCQHLLRRRARPRRLRRRRQLVPAVRVVPGPAARATGVAGARRRRRYSSRRSAAISDRRSAMLSCMPADARGRREGADGDLDLSPSPSSATSARGRRSASAASATGAASAPASASRRRSAAAASTIAGYAVQRTASPTMPSGRSSVCGQRRCRSGACGDSERVRSPSVERRARRAPRSGSVLLRSR